MESENVVGLNEARQCEASPANLRSEKRKAQRTANVEWRQSKIGDLQSAILRFLSTFAIATRQRSRLFDLHWRRFGALLLAAAFLQSCSNAPNEPPVATLGKSALTREELRRSLSYQNREDSVTQATMYLEDWLATAALYEKAMQEGEDKDTLTMLLIEKSRRKIIAARYFERKLQEEIKAGKLRVDSSEAQAFYNLNAGLFQFREPHYRLLRLYASTQDAMLSLRQKLVAGAPETELLLLAQSLSPALAQTNEAMFQRSKEARPLRALQLESQTLLQLLERMRPKDITPVVKVRDSLFAVMRLDEKLEQGSLMTFEQAYPDIEELLRHQKQKAFFRYLVGSSKSALESAK